MAELETPNSPRIHVELGNEDGTPVVSLTGELDLSTTDVARSAMAPALEGPPPRVVLDLSGLEFMDSSGIALMLSVKNEVGTVNIRQPSQVIRRLLEVTGLADTFGIVE